MKEERLQKKMDKEAGKQLLEAEKNQMNVEKGSDYEEKRKVAEAIKRSAEIESERTEAIVAAIKVN